MGMDVNLYDLYCIVLIMHLICEWSVQLARVSDA